MGGTKDREKASNYQKLYRKIRRLAKSSSQAKCAEISASPFYFKLKSCQTSKLNHVSRALSQNRDDEDESSLAILTEFLFNPS